jgi:hypothetical protein
VYEVAPWLLPTAIGVALGTDHPPYHEGEQANLARWLDDLIGLAHRSSGVTIVLDNAATLFSSHRRSMTELIEAFLVQVHHWLDRKIPCHLFFQMSPNPLVRQLFASASEA